MSKKEVVWRYYRPAVAGYWWWQRDAETPPFVVRLDCDAAGNWSCKTIYDHRLTGEGGRWFGPIASPNAFAPWTVTGGVDPEVVVDGKGEGE